jgi:hypothetical protein
MLSSRAKPNILLLIKLHSDQSVTGKWNKNTREMKL